MTVIRVGDENVDVVDADCAARPCFMLGFDKGTFVRGRGYTNYHAKQRAVCWTRHLNGCPHVGVHLKCGSCHKKLGLVMEGEERVRPDVCPECGSDDLYWLADVLPSVLPCCDAPLVPKSRKQPPPWRQKCKSCGTNLTGKRLALVRGEAE